MTICIAAIGQDSKSKEFIVFATDHMISNPAIGQFERKTGKYKKLNENTVAMLSGNPLLFDNLIINCKKKKCSFDEIKNTIHSNMKQTKDEIIQKQILDIFKIDYGFLKEILKGAIQNQYANSIIETISKFTLNTTILLIGFTNGEAQIVEINEHQISELRDINFSAIGSGGAQAINTLLFQKQSREDALSVTLYNVYKAKRNAEVSIGVGKETDIMILTQKNIIEINEEKEKVLSEVYNEELKFGKINKKVNEMLKDIIV
jgi:hypothetical protein